MAQPTYGTHRVKNPGLEDGVWITDGKNGFEIPESRYRENGYKPRVEELPWRSSSWEDVAGLDPAEFAQPLHKGGSPLAIDCGRGRAQEPDDRQLARLLRARCERPRHCSAAEQRDEIATFHSITSSA